MSKIVLILGGSSSIAQELLKLHSEDEVHISYHAKILNLKNSFHLDMSDENTYINIPKEKFDIVYSFLGYTPDLVRIEDRVISRLTMESNFLYPTLLIQYILEEKLVKSKGRIKVITSVAGIRGRRVNFIYGASKSAMQTLLEGLASKYRQHHFTDVVLGPVYTDSVPKHNTPDFLVSEPVIVAREIYKRNAQRVYIPMKWRYILFLIKILPPFLYNRLNF